MKLITTSLKRFIPLFLALVSSAFAASAPTRPAAPPPLRLLILTGRNNHNWRRTTPPLVRMYRNSARFRVDLTEDPTVCTAEFLDQYDVIVSNWSAWPNVNDRPWGPAVEKAFLDFIANGKGFVLFHAASATFHNWPEYQRIVGATWKRGTTGHGRIHTFKVTVFDPNHPVTAAVPDFWIRDELWHRVGTQPNIRVLCKAFSSKQTGGSGRNEPVVICTTFGKGRCFYNILGHDEKTIRNTAWQALMLRGTEWAATGKVTIPLPRDWPDTADKATRQYLTPKSPGPEPPASKQPPSKGLSSLAPPHDAARSILRLLKTRKSHKNKTPGPTFCSLNLPTPPAATDSKPLPPAAGTGHSRPQPHIRPRNKPTPLHRQLQLPVDLSRWDRNTTFGQAIDDLKNSIDPPLPLIVLWRDLYDYAGIDPQTPIRMDGISDLPLNTALNLLLMAVASHPDQIGYSLDGDVITVATKKSLTKNRQIRIYDITDLL